MSKLKRKIVAGLGILMGALVLALILRASPLFEAANQKLTHGLYHEREAFEDIVIVAIDDKSLQDIQEGGLGAFSKWSRDYYAKAITKLREGGAESIFVDVLFAQNTEFITFSELAAEVQTISSYSELGENIAGYLNAHPSDAAMEAAMDKDVVMLKYLLSVEESDSPIPVNEAEQLSAERFSSKSSNAFSTGTSETGHAIYSTPVAILNQGELEETMPVMMARRLLHGEDGVGVISPDGQWYQFDQERRIPIEDGAFLINYSQDAYSVPQISFADLVRGELEADTVNGKIVLIGATAPILQDRHFTPIDAETPMPGIEIQANAIQTILDGNFLKHQSGIGFTLMLGIMLAICVAVAMSNSIWIGLGVLVAEVVAYPFFARWMFGRGVIVDMIWPLVAVLLAYLSTMAYRNFTEFREKRKLETAFGHYVSPELVKQISANAGSLELGGERRIITAMFLDIENFMTLSESLEPHQVVEIINAYFDALANLIMQHGGTVDKFEGDAIMALFGAPVFYEDHALRAAKTALAIRAKMSELNESLGANLNIRIGLATGEAIVGNMGSKQRFDYTAMGDTVNTASRLEGANKFYHTRIMVNPGTFEATQLKMFYRRLDRVRLKGKNEAIDIYELLGTQEAVSEQGKQVVNVWHQALEYYRNQDWDSAVERIQEVQGAMPQDGPSQTYMERIAQLRAYPPDGWDGTWTWEKK